MNDAVWYTRLAVWAGALVLLVQAISGKGASALTLFATLSLALGFVAFLAALAIGPSISPEISETEKAGESSSAGPDSGASADEV